jgi:hypothetical protein
MRLDREGRDVTDLPGLWDESDCEIAMTQFSHPSITSGQHTNGPASIWIRLPDGGVGWLRSSERSLKKTVDAWIAFGIDWFREGDCRDIPV